MTKKEIKGLYDGVNLDNLPKSIYKALSNIGRNRSSSYSNETKTTTYGNLIPPNLKKYPSFIVTYEWEEHLDYLLKKGLFDDDFKQINYDNIESYLVEFGKGFNSAYFNFETTVLKDFNNSLFDLNNEDKAKKIYDFIYDTGNFIFIGISCFTNFENNKNFITLESMYENGYKWGQKYKAWELVLSTPLIFEPLFNKKLEKKNEDKKTTTNNSLIGIITHKNSVEIVNGIKIQYKNIQGKKLKVLLLVLQKLELLPKDRIARKFHTYCKNEFDWNIASYNAMNDYKFNDGIDTIEFNEMEQFIETLMKPI